MFRRKKSTQISITMPNYIIDRFFPKEDANISAFCQEAIIQMVAFQDKANEEIITNEFKKIIKSKDDKISELKSEILKYIKKSDLLERQLNKYRASTGDYEGVPEEDLTEQQKYHKACRKVWQDYKDQGFTLEIRKKARELGIEHQIDMVWNKR